MSQSQKARIALWNAIEAAEAVGGKVIFDLTRGLALIGLMTEDDAARFYFAEHSTNQLHATRRP